MANTRTRKGPNWLDKVLLPAVTVGILACCILSSGCSAVSNDTFQDSAIDVSADGNRICFAAAGDGRRDIYWLDRRTGLVQLVAKTAQWERGPRFVPGSNMLVCSAGDAGGESAHIEQRDLGGTAGPVMLTADEAQIDECPAVSPNGRLVAFARAPKLGLGPNGYLPGSWDVYTVSVKGGAPVQRTTIGFGRLVSLAFSTDGRYVYFNAQRLRVPGFRVFRLDLARPAQPVELKMRLPVYEPIPGPGANSILYCSTAKANPPGGPSTGTVELFRMDGLAKNRWGNPSQLTHGDQPIWSPVLARSTQTVYFVRQSPSSTMRRRMAEIRSYSLTNGTESKVAGEQIFSDPLGGSTAPGQVR